MGKVATKKIGPVDRESILKDLLNTTADVDHLVEAYAEAAIDRTPGMRVDNQFNLRDIKRRLDKASKAIAGLFDTEDGLLRDVLTNELELEAISGRHATFSLGEAKLFGKIVDFDRFALWVRRQDKLYLLERRIAQAAFREELGAKKKCPPGTEIYEQVDSHLRVRS